MIYDKNEVLAEISRVESEITRIDNGDWSQSEFEQFLDDCYPEYTIGNLIFYPSKIFSCCDPIGFDVSCFEYFDSVLSDLRDELKELQENLAHIGSWTEQQAFL